VLRRRLRGFYWQIARAWAVPLPVDAHAVLSMSELAGAAKAIEAGAMLVTIVLRIK
jgi:hypothetical protein